MCGKPALGRRFRGAVSLYFEYCRMSLKSQFFFRLDAVLRTFAVFTREIAGVAVVWIAMSRFPRLGAWTADEMLFLFSFLFLTYSLLIALFTGFRDFDDLVHSGAFDRFLLRPRGLMLQVMSIEADYLACFGHGAVGILLFAYSSRRAGVSWDPPAMSYLLSSVAGGVLIQAAIFVFFASLSLRFVRAGDLFSLLYYNTRKFAGYPLDIFPGFIRDILVFVVPFAFVNYFPAIHLLGKDASMAWWPGVYAMPPLLGVLLFSLVYWFWRRSVRAYSSTGN